MPFNNIGPMELVIVLVIALIVIGPKRLPEVGKSLGKGMREFKDSLSGESRTTRTTSPHRSTRRSNPADLTPAPGRDRRARARGRAQ